MAAGVLPQPGTEFGACLDVCNHTDCAATRQQAASLCPLCDKPIGYDTPFYSTDSGLEHAYCAGGFAPIPLKGGDTS